ncbi:predicted protein [Lichtheimia corymbifera JMRC:FSU:9682]|uniref:Uncharacterized protein n=1 Tax=Lichtheimia corymbifera JMRC:FSU:9682 TaxID=1263082 RepID=A0A068RLX8_9FUNG|nr:predicted protein [Lichtheimia corymbifera JMRC:FSU:9682]
MMKAYAKSMRTTIHLGSKAIYQAIFVSIIIALLPSELQFYCVAAFIIRNLDSSEEKGKEKKGNSLKADTKKCGILLLGSALQIVAYKEAKDTWIDAVLLRRGSHS